MLRNLYIKPVKDKGINKPHYPEFEDHYMHQADLLFLPHDDDFKYALVVVDLGSGMSDGRALKSKEAKEMISAFKSIYRGKILRKPEWIGINAGTEFRGDVEKFLVNDLKIKIKRALPQRHRQQAVVENRNKQIGKIILMRQTAEELITGEPATAWVEDLPEVIQEVNTKRKKKKPKKKKKKKTNDILWHGDACDLIEQGTKVRAMLDAPRDVIQGKRLPGWHQPGWAGQDARQVPPRQARQADPRQGDGGLRAFEETPCGFQHPGHSPQSQR